MTTTWFMTTTRRTVRGADRLPATDRLPEQGLRTFAGRIGSSRQASTPPSTARSEDVDHPGGARRP